MCFGTCSGHASVPSLGHPGLFTVAAPHEDPERSGVISRSLERWAGLVLPYRMAKAANYTFFNALEWRAVVEEPWGSSIAFASMGRPRS